MKEEPSRSYRYRWTCNGIQCKPDKIHGIMTVITVLYVQCLVRCFLTEKCTQTVPSTKF